MRMTRNGLLRVALLVAMLCVLLGAGARVRSEVPAPPPQEQTAYKWTGEEGTLQGVISVEGVVPPRPIISTMASDPVCASLNKGGMRAEDIVVERGRLAYALVYVESAVLDGQTFEPRQWTPALGNRRCHTVPHVLAMQAGQTLYVQNADRTHHNPTFQTKVNPLYNKGLPPGASFEIPFTKPEPPFVVTCRQHPWERGYVAVFPHPFFAVTARNGTFAIEGLPPGDYEVVVWHEKFKETRAKVTVGARESKAVNFSFKYPADVRAQ
ncbi:MAG: carboxypeptidase regulatory-like domain-containing protein [Pyrinomonadaceae bacterium]